MRLPERAVGLARRLTTPLLVGGGLAALVTSGIGEGEHEVSILLAVAAVFTLLGGAGDEAPPRRVYPRGLRVGLALLPLASVAPWGTGGDMATAALLGAVVFLLAGEPDAASARRGEAPPRFLTTVPSGDASGAPCPARGAGLVATGLAVVGLAALSLQPATPLAQVAALGSSLFAPGLALGLVLLTPGASWAARLAWAPLLSVTPLLLALLWLDLLGARVTPAAVALLPAAVTVVAVVAARAAGRPVPAP